jgi:hypothetical protein
VTESVRDDRTYGDAQTNFCQEYYHNAEFTALDTIILVAVIAVATTFQIAGLAYIANQNRKMNDKMTADDASIFLQGRQVQEVLREMRELLRSQS